MSHAQALCSILSRNPQHPDIDMLKILEKRIKVNEPWTKEEHDAFVKATRKYGKDYQKILQEVETKTRDQVQSHALAVCRRLKAHKDQPDADLLAILQQPTYSGPEIWTAQENQRLLEGLKSSLNKNKEWYSSISKIVKTKTYS